MKINIGWSGVLFVVFLTLKLAGSITWSWWWITAPLWVPAGVAAVLFMVAGFFMALNQRDQGRCKNTTVAAAA